MSHVIDAPEQEQTVSEVFDPQVGQPKNSLFHTVATLLGVNRFPSPSYHYNEDREPAPPETARDLMASRYPYFYFQSLSG